MILMSMDDAFDRVDCAMLLEKLLKKNFSLRTLLSWYSNQHVSIWWNSSHSELFSVSNGVRQGGVLSRILFTVYTDDLLLHLENTRIGCYWNHYYVRAACYADDIVLLAPSLSALHYMLQTCSDFADSHNQCLNSLTSQCVPLQVLQSLFSGSDPNLP